MSEQTKMMICPKAKTCRFPCVHKAGHAQSKACRNAGHSCPACVPYDENCPLPTRLPRGGGQAKVTPPSRSCSRKTTRSRPRSQSSSSRWKS